MTDQEMFAMQGVEFIYMFEDGDWMPAYVKKVDIKRMVLTCWSFSFITNCGHIFEPIDDEEEKEGASCLFHQTDKEKVIKMLKQISEDGIVCAPQDLMGTFNGCPL